MTQYGVRALTRAQFSFEPRAVEIGAFAVFAPHLPKRIGVAGALSAQTVASPAADGAVRPCEAVGVIRRAVVLQRALASRTQVTLVALTHATLVGPVAVATDGAVGLGFRLTLATAGKVHCNF